MAERSDVTPHQRRRTDSEPITLGELARRLDRHEQQSDRLHREQLRMIEKIDARTDILSTRVAVIFAVVAVLWAIFLVLAPAIRTFLNLSNG